MKKLKRSKVLSIILDELPSAKITNMNDDHSAIIENGDHAIVVRFDRRNVVLSSVRVSHGRIVGVAADVTSAVLLGDVSQKGVISAIRNMIPAS